MGRTWAQFVVCFGWSLPSQHQAAPATWLNTATKVGLLFAGPGICEGFRGS